MPFDHFSVSIDIKRFQDLLETSVDETERRALRRLFTEEKTKAALKAPEPDDD
jgi:hypothetical protein